MPDDQISLIITSLLLVVNRLDASWLSRLFIHKLDAVVSITCRKSANIRLHEVWFPQARRQPILFNTLWATNGPDALTLTFYPVFSDILVVRVLSRKKMGWICVNDYTLSHNDLGKHQGNNWPKWPCCRLEKLKYITVLMNLMNTPIFLTSESESSLLLACSCSAFLLEDISLNFIAIYDNSVP